MSNAYGYYHTSTYMYRNIFRGRVLDYYKRDIYRGDTPRTTFHLMYSNKKMHIHNFVGSAYCYNNNGIWSKLKVAEQHEYQINYLKHHREVVRSDYEKRRLSINIESYEKRRKENDFDYRKYITITYDDCLWRIRRYASTYAFKERDYILNGVYYSEFLDTAAATIGYVFRVYHKELMQTEANENNICIVNGVLNPHGGGIMKEIAELCKIYADKTVFLFVTNMQEVPEEARKALSDYHNVTIIIPPVNCPEKLDWLCTKYKAISPCKTYFYASHNDSFGAALAHAGAGQNILLFSFDHGFLMGAGNPYLDTIVAKRATDYKMLQKKFGERVIYIPAWNVSEERAAALQYEPFRDHNRLITASGAARFYKVEGGKPYSYLDLIAETLALTHGRHYHYGPMPEEKLAYIRERLEEYGLPEDTFVNIEWADSMSEDCLKRNVDIFVEPFPVVSYKMSLDIMSAGIPIYAFDGLTRMSNPDFIYSGCMRWGHADEFAPILAGLTKEVLKKQSVLAKEYYSANYDFALLSPWIREVKQFREPEDVYFVDDVLNEICDHLSIFGADGRIVFMAEEEQRIAEAKKAEEARKAEKAKKEKEAKARKEIDKLKTSFSYRVGQVLIFIPKKINMVTHGIKYTDAAGKVLSGKEYEKYAYEHKPVEELKRLKAGKAYRYGKAITKPVRKIYRKIKKKI